MVLLHVMLLGVMLAVLLQVMLAGVMLVMLLVMGGLGGGLRRLGGRGRSSSGRGGGRRRGRGGGARVGGAGAERRHRESERDGQAENGEKGLFHNRHFLFEDRYVAGRTRLLREWLCHPVFSRVFPNC
ncbi:MAG: hypothetical protein E5V45_33040 [Mesorhizobium sp.]|nr:MAG: hypothetical protein EOS47_32070 [Mesorhizobium sp.]TIW92382.1 MAG: hypothetical protein E5V45_33040 [Mesorhizobium sp.]